MGTRAFGKRKCVHVINIPVALSPPQPNLFAASIVTMAYWVYLFFLTFTNGFIAASATSDCEYGDPHLQFLTAGMA